MEIQMNKIEMLQAVELSSKYSMEMLFTAFCASAASNARDFTEGTVTRAVLKDQAHLFVSDIACDQIADDIDDRYLDTDRAFDLEELAKCVCSMLIDNVSSLRTLELDVPVVKREIVEL
jgi:hypothetical protein